LGVDGCCELSESIAWICAALDLAPDVRYGRGERHRTLDSPCMQLDTSRARRLGWLPRLGLHEALLRTVGYLQENPWLLRARGAPVRPATAACMPRAESPAAGRAADP